MLRVFESGVTRSAAATLVVSQREAEALQSLDPGFAPGVMPNGVDVGGFRNPGEP